MYSYNGFKAGELIIYTDGETYEIGRIKRLTADEAFVCYHEGATAAKTPYERMLKLANARCIKETFLGGNVS